ncbi:HNH endonuclease [Acinetobacter pittii]|nr:HNH endonuclease [Acinetobacter pittii]
MEKLVLERDKDWVHCGCEFGTKKSKKVMGTIIHDIKITMLDNIALCCVGFNVSKGNKELSNWLYYENAHKRGITSDTIAEVIRVALKL